MEKIYDSFLVNRKWKNIVASYSCNDVKCGILVGKIRNANQSSSKKRKKKFPLFSMYYEKKNFFLSISFNKMWNSEINEKEFETQIDSRKNSRYFLPRKKKKKKKKMKKLFFPYNEILNSIGIFENLETQLEIALLVSNF